MKIGWIGTGVMGRSMAGHVQGAGHELFVHNRTKAKAEELLKKATTQAPGPRSQIPERDEVRGCVRMACFA